jgi:hypothetical protein
MSITSVNLTNDYEPSAPISLDNCFENMKKITFEKLPLQTPLVNVMSSIDDLKFASMKVDEIQQLLKEQKMEHEQKLYKVITSQWSILGTVSLLLLIICICCCCKGCKNCIIRLWNKWNLNDCWQDTKDKCYIKITNYICPEVIYTKIAETSSTNSLNTPSKLESVKNEREALSKEKRDSLSLRTRSKNVFR